MNAAQASSGDGGRGEGLHASALIVGESGVLIRGPSGSGKSALTLALLGAAVERGMFAAVVGDDRVFVRVVGGRILATGAPDLRGLVERRGQGIVGAAWEPRGVVRLVVDLAPIGARLARHPENEALSASLCGIALPRLAFDDATRAFERAHAVLEHLQGTARGDGSEAAHFA